MSIRKRTWKTDKGVKNEAWVVDYVDQGGKRRHKTFARKKQADAFASTASTEIRQGVHVADSASVTVQQAGELWIASAEAAGLERSTIEGYRSVLRLHIAPILGTTLLSRLSAPMVRGMEDRLREQGKSPDMLRRCKVYLGMLVGDAVERGLVARNIVRELRRRRRSREVQVRHIEVGVDVPTREEVKTIVQAATGTHERAFSATLIFTGLRSSELRGLRWVDVDFDARALNVRQRADSHNMIGPPKSKAGKRTVPLPPLVLNVLREWKLACPKRDTGRKDAQGNAIKELYFVFPNGKGNVNEDKVLRRALVALEIACGVTVDTGKLDEQGAPIFAAKYPGLHAFRHFFASWCINRVKDGGLELPAKVVQERLGHANIAITLDTYGHLFPRGDDADELAAAERALLA